MACDNPCQCACDNKWHMFATMAYAYDKAHTRAYSMHKTQVDRR